MSETIKRKREEEREGGEDEPLRKRLTVKEGVDEKKQEEKQEEKKEEEKKEEQKEEEKKEEQKEEKKEEQKQEQEQEQEQKQEKKQEKNQEKKQEQKQDKKPTPPMFKKEGKDLMDNIFRLRSARNSSSSTARPTTLASSSSPAPPSSPSSAPSLPDSSSLPPLPSSPFKSSSESPFLLASVKKEKEVSEKERNPKKRAGEVLDEGRRGEKKAKKSGDRIVTFSSKKKGAIEDKYKAEANSAVAFSLVNYKRQEETEKFHPQFTHQVYEEDETILGFDSPSIAITFACDSFDINIETSWEDKLPGVSATSLREKVEKYLPKGKPLAPSLSMFFENLVKERTQTKWKPPGEKIFEYESSLPFCDVPPQEQMKVGVWKADFSNAAARALFDKLQVLSIFFIDGASLLDITDYTWIVYFLYGYDTHTDSYCFMGFSTVYPFWNPNDLIRPRISQFLILPPFQGKGHGVRMLKCIYGDLLSSLSVSDVTVEDPSPSFQSMRDRVDVERCMSHGFLKDDQECTPEIIKQIQEKTKLPKMQILRCFDIVTLWKIGLFANSELLKPLRLQMKKRYYKENKEALNVGTVEDRKKELDEFFTEAIAQYRRVGESLVKAGILLPPPSSTPLLS